MEDDMEDNMEKGPVSHKLMRDIAAYQPLGSTMNIM